ncbi:aminotransferase [Thalassovita mediterranea]|jgi:aspartate/methionine/tyrosine aminotransferase|uniref:Aminotransferase n=1 Tax=Thalassovita mediterranea TaxID=340021 RepID=A0A0P1GP53_9RHOB|nr:aminotransferase [Thalassovita mediterranea]CUH84098.1 Aspartate aminotransferase [Thalassovita mediterranea]SIS27732.1 Aspartate/methionine/tyrosine aminotransferase [Thalassovita mediterranea]
MYIRPFGVEMWMNEFETKCELNLAETCVTAMTLGDLAELSGQGDALWPQLTAMQMTYGAIEGSDRLRDAICGLYDRQTRDNILTTHGTIGANSLVHQTLVARGDHVISVIPTYQQHYSIPESIGAEVELLHLRAENDFLPDLEELRQMVRPDTKLIAINNPNNPTGALMDRACLEQIVEIARSVDAWLLCDEVYRGTDQVGDGMTAAIADLYEKGISTAGMSKAYSLAGLRVGWVAGPKDMLHEVMLHRDYNTISVGKIDEFLAAIALENRDKILSRSRQITRDNLAILEEWIAGEPLISWVKPKSGTTALLRYDLDMSSRDFCVTLLQEEGVMLTPGSAMDMEGWLRIGYTNPTDDLTAGLARISAFLKRHGAQV